jgi:muramoyltetrapeptide carboxypeptidase
MNSARVNTMNSYRLQPGDEVRIIAPSGAWNEKKVETYERARLRLEAHGLSVTYGTRIRSQARFGTGVAADRLADLYDAYRDPKVKLIVALHGGWSANALLRGIDWKLLAQNPKPLLGFSDLTVLVNAIYAKTGIVNYLGPTFSSLGHRQAAEYTLDNVVAVVMGSAPVALQRSKQWQRTHRGELAKTRPWKVLQPGASEGVLTGGNLGTFYLLQGTPYQPRFDQPTILAVEDDEAGKFSAREFDRRLESLLQLPGARENIRGLLIGRFQPSSRVNMPDIRDIVDRMRLEGVPVVADIDFGHTSPMLTLPIGGRLSIQAENNQAKLNLLQW